MTAADRPSVTDNARAEADPDSIYHEPPAWCPGCGDRIPTEIIRERGVCSNCCGTTDDPWAAGRAEVMWALYDAVTTIKETDGAVEIHGVRIEPCDTYGQTETTRALDREPYTPSTGTVRIAYVTSAVVHLDTDRDQARAEFERWLAQVQAEAYQRGVDDWADEQGRIVPNPYRQATP